VDKTTKSRDAYPQFNRLCQGGESLGETKRDTTYGSTRRRYRRRAREVTFGGVGARIGRWKRMALGTLVAVILLTLTVQDFCDFVVRHDGIEFYRKQPWLLAVCLAIGIVVGLLAQLWHNVSKRARNRPEVMKEE
jgi:hypothetical protein